ncbi:DUF485 domain-containing protein [Variovorax sp. ZT5P30]
MTIPHHIRIASHPLFRDLVKRRTRFALLLSGTVLVTYYGFMMAVALLPGLLRIPLDAGRVSTIAWPIGVSVIVLSWLLTGLYVYRANRDFDGITVRLLAEVKP